jgi:hypothetical protein
MKQKTKKLIGVVHGRFADLKPEYATKKGCYYITIEHDTKTKMLDVQVKTLKQGLDELFGRDEKKAKPTKAEIAAQKKRDEEWEKNKNKPVDTSNWVKPDTESIRQELLKQLVMCEMLKDDCNAMIEATAKRDIAYSILHSHSPSNPQGLTNYHIHDNYDAILRELENPLQRYTWDLTDKVGKDYSIEKYRKERNDWKKKQLSKMITVF